MPRISTIKGLFPKDVLQHLYGPPPLRYLLFSHTKFLTPLPCKTSFVNSPLSYPWSEWPFNKLSKTVITSRTQISHPQNKSVWRLNITDDRKESFKKLTKNNLAARSSAKKCDEKYFCAIHWLFFKKNFSSSSSGFFFTWQQNAWKISFSSSKRLLTNIGTDARSSEPLQLLKLIETKMSIAACL
jgi:hypothetical protein